MSDAARDLRVSQGASWLTLATSAGTLVCCALPAALVAFGAGATLASLVTHVPQLVWLSGQKLSIFMAAGVMLAASGWLQWRARSLPCPADPALAAACARSRRISLAVYWASLAVFALGGLFAYAIPALS